MRRKRNRSSGGNGRHDAQRCVGWSRLVVTLVFGGVAAVTGCSRGEAVAAPPTGTLLAVVPGDLSECASYDGIAQVTWDASRVGASRVRVEVGQLGNTDSRVFYEGGGKSSMVTGPWVRAGTVFILFDGDTGALLDSFEVKARPCL